MQDNQKIAAGAQARVGHWPAPRGVGARPIVADALDFLEQQHVAVQKLFDDLVSAAIPAEKMATLERVADELAIHTTIEERHFYPAIRERRTEDLLMDSLHEHLAIKRAIVDLVQLDPAEDAFDEKVKTLREIVTRHIQADEAQLFPRVREVFTPEDLSLVAEAMQAEVAQMEGTGARFRVFPEAVDPPLV
jgi:hemerythrin superfamily protein